MIHRVVMCVGLLLIVFSVGCSSSGGVYDDCDTASLGCDCTKGGTCDEDLVCVDDKCLKPHGWDESPDADSGDSDLVESDSQDSDLDGQDSIEEPLPACEPLCNDTRTLVSCVNGKQHYVACPEEMECSDNTCSEAITAPDEICALGHERQCVLIDEIDVGEDSSDRAYCSPACNVATTCGSDKGLLLARKNNLTLVFSVGSPVSFDHYQVNVAWWRQQYSDQIFIRWANEVEREIEYPAAHCVYQNAGYFVGGVIENTATPQLIPRNSSSSVSVVVNRARLWGCRCVKE